MRLFNLNLFSPAVMNKCIIPADSPVRNCVFASVAAADYTADRSDRQPSWSVLCVADEAADR